MKETKAGHTPGPWKDRGNGFITYANNPSLSSVICHTENENPDAKANARLIAAAPELLEFAYAYLSNSTCTEWPELYRMAKAAIAKAEGK